MSSIQDGQPTFLSVAPRFRIQNIEQALAFYGQLGFQTTWRDEEFVIVERDRVNIHMNCYPDSPPHPSVCWIEVENIDALYQRCLSTNAIREPLEAKPWKMREFLIRDPFRNLILFAEKIPDEEANSTQEAEA